MPVGQFGADLRWTGSSTLPRLHQLPMNRPAARRACLARPSISNSRNSSEAAKLSEWARCFGASVARPAALVLVVCIGSLLPGCRSSSARPDIVVAIVRKCEITSVQGGKLSTGVEATGPRCSEVNSDGSAAARYVRQQLTVRTESGSTYVVELDQSVHVELGERWPLVK